MLDSEDPNGDNKLWVKFYPGKILNTVRTREMGSDQYDFRDFIEIRVPGDQNNINDRPVVESDKFRWRRQWESYKAGQDYIPESGEPLESWPRLNTAQVATYKGLGFHTVESIADADDAKIQSLGMDCYGIRERAKARIKNARDSSFAQRLADEAKIKDEQIQSLRDELTRIGSLVEEKTKRKYTKKAA